MLKKNSILFYSILFYSVNIEAKNVVKDFFIKGEKIITWNGISSTSIQMYNRYNEGTSEDNKDFNGNSDIFIIMYHDNSLRYIKNKYELIRNLFSFSFYCKNNFSSRFFFVFNFNFFDNTNFKQKERLKIDEKFEKGAERIGVLSILFGIGFYWFNKNNLKLSSSFSLGFLWARDNAMVLANYKKKVKKDSLEYYEDYQINYSTIGVRQEKILFEGKNILEFHPFHPFTWRHGDILFKIEILSIQYKHFYIGCTWQRGIFDTIKVIKNQWWECLPSTISIEIGYILK